MSIPEKVIDSIKARIKKKITVINNANVKLILKMLYLQKYQSNIVYIMKMLGDDPPILSSEIKEKLYRLFSGLEEQYAIHALKEKSNMMNYTYILYRLLDYLNQPNIIGFIPTFKSFVKQTEQCNLFNLLFKNIIV